MNEVRDEFHGWSKGRESFYVGHIPTRKSIALYNGTTGELYAYFRNEELATAFVALMDRMLDPIWREARA